MNKETEVVPRATSGTTSDASRYIRWEDEKLKSKTAGYELNFDNSKIDVYEKVTKTTAEKDGQIEEKITKGTYVKFDIDTNISSENAISFSAGTDSGISVNGQTNASRFTKYYTIQDYAKGNVDMLKFLKKSSGDDYTISGSLVNVDDNLKINDNGKFDEQTQDKLITTNSVIKMLNQLENNPTDNSTDNFTINYYESDVTGNIKIEKFKDVQMRRVLHENGSTGNALNNFKINSRTSSLLPNLYEGPFKIGEYKYNDGSPTIEFENTFYKFIFRIPDIAITYNDYLSLKLSLLVYFDENPDNLTSIPVNGIPEFNVPEYRDFKFTATSLMTTANTRGYYESEYDLDPINMEKFAENFLGQGEKPETNADIYIHFLVIGFATGSGSNCTIDNDKNGNSSHLNRLRIFEYKLSNYSSPIIVKPVETGTGESD